jgi:hypothetical protein
MTGRQKKTNVTFGAILKYCSSPTIASSPATLPGGRTCAVSHHATVRKGRREPQITVVLEEPLHVRQKASHNDFQWFAEHVIEFEFFNYCE